MKPNNQIHCIELLNDDTSQYKTQVFKHDFGEIWKLNASPFDSQVLASVYSSYVESQITMKTALLKIPDAEKIDDSNGQEYLLFDEVIELNIEEAGEIRTTEFNPVNPDLLATVVDGKLLIHNRAESSFKCVAEVQTSKSAPKFSGGKWAQHTAGNHQFICLHDGSVRSYDIRDVNHSAWSIEDAHGQQLVRDLDCNPNKQCHIVTGGDDGSIKIWDWRNTKQSVFNRTDHYHWVFSVRYNTFHDSLLLSSSSDGKVLLTCAQSVSSEADDVGNKSESLSDGLLHMFDQHEDSVYCADWSSTDPWTFASLSYDGRVIISKVPKQYKYQLLS